MKHLSLFSGIGGFDLAAEWMGWENIAHCEWNPFGQRVLKYYWPNAISYHDITKTDFTIHRGTIDIVTGGFPCQPYSVAGKRKGKDDERHLWPEMLRAIREIQPRWVVGENVGGLLSWNGGLVFNEVQADLEAEGYEILPFLLPAAGVNAPHKRDRIWFVACRRECVYSDTESIENIRRGPGGFQSVIARVNAERIVTNTSILQSQRIEFSRSPAKERPFETKSRQSSGSICSNWEEFPTQPPVCNGDDGISSQLDGITFSKWRNESIKAGGNAIVPQVALQIFKSIEQYENLNL